MKMTGKMLRMTRTETTHQAVTAQAQVAIQSLRMAPLQSLASLPSVEPQQLLEVQQLPLIWLTIGDNLVTATTRHLSIDDMATEARLSTLVFLDPTTRCEAQSTHRADSGMRMKLLRTAAILPILETVDQSRCKTCILALTVMMATVSQRPSHSRTRRSDLPLSPYNSPFPRCLCHRRFTMLRRLMMQTAETNDSVDPNSPRKRAGVEQPLVALLQQQQRLAWPWLPPQRRMVVSAGMSSSAIVTTESCSNDSRKNAREPSSLKNRNSESLSVKKREPNKGRNIPKPRLNDTKDWRKNVHET